LSVLYARVKHDERGGYFLGGLRSMKEESRILLPFADHENLCMYRGWDYVFDVLVEIIPGSHLSHVVIYPSEEKLEKLLDNIKLRKWRLFGVFLNIVLVHELG
jgi:hypothetical protein